MSLKKIIRRSLEKLGNSSLGPKVYSVLSGMSSIIEYQTYRPYRETMTGRLSITDLTNQQTEQAEKTSEKQTINETTNKIKIRFYHCSASTFNVIQTICENFKNDSRFDLLIVLFGNSYAGMVKQMKDYGYSYIEEYNYNLSEDRPDISVVYHAEILYPPQLTKIREFSKYVVMNPLGIGTIWFGDRTVRRLNLNWFRADLIFVGNLCYDRLIKPIGDDKIELCSPAQFDLAYRKMSEPAVYPNGWGKLKGKKTVVFMTDHGLHMDHISDEVTFDLYFKPLVKYMQKHQECGLIFRLHPALIKELVSTFWSLEDYKKFIEYCNESPNIVWDETNDYLTSLSLADGVVVDCNCTLVYFVLAAKKPIAVPLRNDMPVIVNNPPIVDKYYKISSEEQLVEYLDLIRLGNDPKKDLRMKAFDEYVKTFDGKNGERMAEVIKKRYFDYIKIEG